MRAASLPFACIVLFSTNGVNTASLAAAGATIAVAPSALSFAVYATGMGCSAITMAGGAFVDSFDSSQGSYSQTKKQSQGIVGVSGNISLSGSKTIVFGSIAALNTSVGSCNNGIPGITLSGGAKATGGYIQLGAAPSFPTPATPIPGSQDVNVAGNLTLPPGSYRNITVSGGHTLTFSPGTYNINSLTLSGQSVLALASSGQVIVNVAGTNVAQPLNLSGGAISNPSALPLNFQLIYAGSQQITLSGGSASYGLVYAPNAAATLSGGGDWYGAMTVKTFDDSGGSPIHYDRSLIVPPTITATLTPAPNANGWNHTNVTVSFACSDVLGIASCSSPVALTAEGRNQVVSGTAVDHAGNTATTTVAVNVDKTPPVVAATTSPGPNANGWNNTSVVVAFAATDGLSGVAPGSVTGPATLSANAANQSASGVAADLAGNTASTIRSGINIDQIPPTIAVALTPAANANGWNRGPVTAHFTCGDALSGIASCPPDQMIATNGTGQTVTGTATDRAGNAASVTSAPFSIDQSTPTISVALSPPPNANGWNNTPVMAHFTCADSTSGIATCPPDQIIATDGAGQTVTGTATSLAGTTASVTSTPVNLDQGRPTIGVALGPAPNATGWNSGPVTAHFTCGDVLSGMASCPTDQVIATNGAGQTVSGTATDRAGNTASVTSGPFSIDQSTPTISVALSPAPNANGWNNTPVSAHFACADSTSGIATCPPDQVVGTDGAGQTVTGTATSVAGITASVTSAPFNLDQAKPIIGVALSPAPNTNGWNSGPVTAHFTCGDALSGIAVCPADQVVLVNGTNQTVSGAATDNAGNTASATSNPFNIDQTPPAFSFVSPANGTTVSTSTVTVTGTATDALSGVAGASCNGLPAAMSGPSVSCAVPLSTGSNVIVVTVTDVAGNSSTSTLNVVFQAASIAPTITITSPADSSNLSSSPTAVTGSVSDPNATVTVNGLPALVVNGTWSLSVPLVQGPSVVTAQATNAAGTNTASITVMLTVVQGPQLSLSVQPPISPTFDTSQVIAGTVGGAVGQTALTIVGGASAVNQSVPSGQTQFGLAVPLRPNAENVLTVTATDSTGQRTSASDLHVVQLSLSSLVTAQVTAQRLTTAQVEALVANGTISLSDPANFNVSTFSLALNVAGRPAPVTVSVRVIKPVDELLGIGPPITLTCGAPDSDIVETATGYVIPCDNKDTLPPLPPTQIIPFEIGFPTDVPALAGTPSISGVLLLDGTIKTLKEFYKATLLLTNVSSNFTLTDISAKVTVPDHGLSPIAPASGAITMDDLVAGAQGSGQFIIRGDLIGTHTVTVNFGGQVTGGGLSAPVLFSGNASTSVEVDGPPNLNVTVEHPADVTAEVPYTLTVNIQDTSTIDALYASLELDLAGADLIDPTTGLPFTGANVASLGNILAGQTVSQSYTVLPHSSGPITSCVGGATVNLTLSVVFSGGSGPDCAVGTLPSQIVTASGQPTVTVLPAPNTTNVPLDATISAFFSDEIQTHTLTLGANGTFRLADNTGMLVVGQLQFSPLTNGATAAVFRPSAALKGSTTYTIFISPDIFDINEAHLASGITASFTTAPPPPADITPPQVTARIQSPGDPSAIPVGQLVRLLVNASDDSSVVARLDLQLDGDLIDARGPVSSVTFLIDTSGLQPGSSHVVTAVATDPSGNTASTSLNFAIIADTTPPTVSLTVAPTVVRGQTLPVSAQAHDDVVVARVDAFLDGGADPIYSGSVAPYHFSLNTTTLSNGSHQLSALVTDGAGNTGQAAQAFSVASVTSLAISPALVTITGIGATQALLVIGTFSDGSVAPITSGLTFLSTDPSTATVSPSGVVTSVAPGTATIATAIQSPAPLLATVGITVVGAVPTTLTLVSGDQQSGLVGQPVTAPLVIRVTDANGLPVSGVAVTFQVAAGGGALTAQVITTDGHGLASTTLTLGAIPGSNTVTATAGGLTGSPVTFHARGISNQPPTLLNPGNQSNTEGTVASLQLTGSDPNGNALTYNATGLPASLSINSATGLIAGTLSVPAGAYPITITATNGTLSSRQDFTWTVTTPLTPFVDVSTTLNASPAAVSIGGAVMYTVTVSNFGSAPATGVVATDVLPAGLVFVSASVGCANSGTTISCNDGVLAPAQVVTHIITAVPYAAGPITNSVSVASAQLDVAPSNNTANAVITVVASPPGAPGLIPTGAAEVFTSANSSWSPTGAMSTPRAGSTLTVLGDGTVLVLGGINASANAPSAVATGELYNPSTGVWTATASLLASRAFHTATLLPTGDVLITGGVDASGNPVATSEVYRGPPIQRITPVLTWPTPASMVYGTPLGNAQLNASSNVAGTFTYSPPAGTILSAGSHMLSVTFVPTNTIHFAIVTATVTLTVTP